MLMSSLKRKKICSLKSHEYVNMRGQIIIILIIIVKITRFPEILVLARQKLKD